MPNKTLDNKGNVSMVGTLQEAIKQCRKQIEAPLMKQQEILAEYSNGWYSSETRTRRPLNMVARAINILLPLLVSKNPRAMVRPRVIQLAPYAETLRLTLNHLVEKIKLGGTLREAVLNALTYMGIVKTGICAGGPRIKDAFGYTHDSGQIFCDIIYPEDYFFDISARRRDEVDFEGNWFYVPYDYISDPQNGFKNIEHLQKAYTESDKLSAKKISEDRRGKKIETIKPYVKLAEVWIPGENIVVTIPEEGQGTEVLKVVDYSGPISGPYDTLSLSTFPESIIPVAPLFINLDLHYLINIMARKMARQANREKKVLAYQGNAADDATSVVNSKDGDSVKVDDINAMKEIEYGGTADASYQWVEWLKNNYSEQGSNLNLMSGLKAQSPTLGQEQMLQANSMAIVDDMVDAVHTLVRNILHKMSYYVFTDPLMDITVSKRVSGIGEIPVKVTADTREGDFWDYNFDVEPYSMQRMNPTLRTRRLMEITTGLILPTMQLAAMQGAMLDVPNLVKAVCRDMDLTDSEIDEIYKTVTSGTQSLGPYQQLPQKLPVGGVGDQQGASGASRDLNAMQQINRTGGEQPSPSNTNNL